jgi:hypothetical protein
MPAQQHAPRRLSRYGVVPGRVLPAGAGRAAGFKVSRIGVVEGLRRDRRRRRAADRGRRYSVTENSPLVIVAVLDASLRLAGVPENVPSMIPPLPRVSDMARVLLCVTQS